MGIKLILREPVPCIERADLQFFGQLRVVLRWAETQKSIWFFLGGAAWSYLSRKKENLFTSTCILALFSEKTYKLPTLNRHWLNEQVPYLATLYQMIWETAWPDLVALIIRAPQKFVRVVVVRVILKVRGKNLRDLNFKWEATSKCLDDTCITEFFDHSLLFLCSCSGSRRPWSARASKSKGGGHFELMPDLLGTQQAQHKRWFCSIL